MASAVRGEPPLPGRAATIAELTERLRLLRAWAGMSYRTVQREVTRARIARGVPELPVYNTIYRCFQPERTRLDVDLVVDIAQVLLGDRAGAEQWRQAYLAVLGGSTAAAIVDVADALPADNGTFTGRDRELRGILDAAAPVVCIVGMPGIGKTSLARQAARIMLGRRQFPDLFLMVDLRGFDPDRPPVDPAAVLDRFLRSLGVPGEEIQRLDRAGRTARFRRLLAGKRALLLLDNAADESQVDPLLPLAPHCMTLVTSRRGLAGIEDAQQLDLDVLPPAEAVDLLRAVGGEDRVGVDPHTAGDICELLGRLPLALVLTASRIQAADDWTLRDHFDRLDRHRRTLRLDHEVDLSVGLSYHGLPTEPRRLLRLLAIHPGETFDAYSAAALAGTDPSAAQRVLDQLATAHLLQHNGSGRYRFHDLIRVYATDRAHEEDPSGARGAAITRLLAYYARTTTVAMDLLAPYEKGHRPEFADTPTATPDFVERVDALSWLDTERANLLAAAVYAADHGTPEHASYQSATLRFYLDSCDYFDEGLLLHSIAAAVDDPAARSHALNDLGMTYRRLNRHDEARAHHQRALDISREIGDLAEEARSRNGLGIVAWRVGDYAEARDHLVDALAGKRRVGGDLLGESRLLNNLSLAYERMARYDEALACLRESYELAEKLDDEPDMARVSSNIGLIYVRQGRPAEAIPHYERALAIAQQTASMANEGMALDYLGLAEMRLGRYAQARAHQERALEIARAIPDRSGEAMTLRHLGDVCCRQGEYETALSYHRQAVDVARQAGGAAADIALNGVGEAETLMGMASDALGHHERALTVADQIGDRYEQARAHAGIGQAHFTVGDHGAARRHWKRAHEIYAALDIPEAADIAERIAGIDGTRSG